ncbi:hypothetical protein [Streptomyces sp. gb1(2016)]|uniref:DUF8108 domain-containing protein n=1 Tax=Streptomyces sp. gb1(2016) TaxID=1828321 RepID=A0A652KLP1_9ACTN|nr:hypothetical protein [Streptomyces sp. gb1(2016)]TXS24486.1 hypothetical protein EAO74_29100 [Streptomyces sp. gb1(2016)]
MKRRRGGHGHRHEASLEPPPGYYGASTGTPDATQRGLILDWVVSRRVAAGWRVESRSGSQAVLVRGQPVNHVLHAFLTVFTCLVWGGVWAVLALTNDVERVVLTVDAQGQVVTVGAP